MAEEAETSLGKQTLAGLKWVYIGTASGLILQILYTSVMNRLLTPVEFGLVASAQVVLRFGKYASELGLGPALVQRPTLSSGDIRAAVTSSTLLGLALAAGMAVCAPLLEVFFDSPDVVPVFRALSLTLLLNTMTIVPKSLLSRALRFKALALAELMSFVLGYLGLGLGFGYAGAGVWSLVAAAIGQLVIMVAAAYALTRHPLRPSFAFGAVSSLYTFGGKVSVITLMEYGLAVSPAAIVGRYSGIAPLGQFNRATLVVELPLVNFSHGLSKVLFPALSRIQDDRVKVREAYLSAMRTSGAVIVPVAVGAAVAAPELVELLLGPQWDVAASLVPALSAAAAFAFMSHYGGVVCEALDVLNTKLVLTAVMLGSLVGGLLVVPDGELMGYALVLVAVQAAGTLAYALLMSRELSITAAEQVGVYVPAVISGGLVGGSIWLVTQVGTAVSPPLVVLVGLQIITGAAVLCVLAWYGPLRPMRLDVLDRIERAGYTADQSRAVGMLMALLRIGGVPATVESHG
ncbi:oligosaccharide flippase family protein [Euzebya tangerina]|uniref:oligosaccharide flippase family protein n=1 Tax=Euzebya tangerina TaxID=591198 RepID=UPI0013C3389E|nr:oligosaccharide flippase family protein [Euzebya tangerina]